MNKVSYLNPFTLDRLSYSNKNSESSPIFRYLFLSSYVFTHITISYSYTVSSDFYLLWRFPFILSLLFTFIHLLLIILTISSTVRIFIQLDVSSRWMNVSLSTEKMASVASFSPCVGKLRRKLSFSELVGWCNYYSFH